MKGQISIVEAVTTAIVLIVAFNIIIQKPSFENKWSDAIVSVNGRDVILAADRLGKLYGYSFSEAEFVNFISGIGATRDSIVNVDIQGTPKATIYIACDCTSAQTSYVQGVLSDVKFNGRSVNSVVCSTTLPAINPCGSGSKYPDVLIIWGYKNLDSSIAGLSSFVKSGGGVIEIADMQQAQVTLPQQRIFGLKWLTNNPFPLTGSDQFVKPLNASSTTYQSYKWFYHLPYNLTALPSGPIPTEGGIAPCGSSATTGNFRFHSTTRKFWICGGASVYLDTNTMPNDIADTIKLVKQNFTIDNSNFLLSYIEGSSKIRVSFKQDYAFNDFLVRDNTYNKLYPIDNDIGKILLNFGYWDLLQEQPVAVAILNGTSGKTVWLADFGRNGLASTGDDHKQLLSALIFSVVNRETTQTFSTIGKITSYVNTNNTDIFEVYRIDLEVGSPF